MPSAALPLRFVQSASDVGQLPDAEREVALVGRSNVGKSSLLNALAGSTSLARTSKTPGATRLINVFELSGSPGRWLVDLPGYGYAKVSQAERRRWATMIERYLHGRETLDTVLLLVDGEVGPDQARPPDVGLPGRRRPADPSRGDEGRQGAVDAPPEASP